MLLSTNSKLSSELVGYFLRIYCSTEFLEIISIILGWVIYWYFYIRHTAALYSDSHWNIMDLEDNKFRNWVPLSYMTWFIIGLSFDNLTVHTYIKNSQNRYMLRPWIYTNLIYFNISISMTPLLFSYITMSSWIFSNNFLQHSYTFT